jgi:thiosulfate reductase / polysulfide reductase chain A
MKTRRDFIKITAAGTGGLAIALTPIKFLSGLAPDEKSDPMDSRTVHHRFPTYCEVCFWKCAGWTYVNQGGDILKVIGHDDDPHCNGRLCPRGTGGTGMYHDSDRLKTPMIRTSGEDGKQVFRQASWEEAISLVASKFKEISSKHGPESIALFKHGSSGHYLEHLFSAFGSNTFSEPSFAQCRGPREIGWIATYGQGVGSPESTDIRDTRCLVLIGSHLGENMHNGQVQEMSDAIDKGATIITVDPRFSTAASKSKYWLPIKPSTDLALLLSWIHVILFDELFDKEYVALNTTGLEQLKEHVRKYTPEWAYGITTIEPGVIRDTAREMAEASPAVIVHPGRHVTWYGDDTQRTRAIAIINALLGSWGNRGGFFFLQKISVPDFPHPEFPQPKWNWKTLLDGRFPLANTGVTNAVIEASIPTENKEARVKAWMVSGTNLPVAIPDKSMLMKAFDALDFVVVVDTMPTEITGYADVILPECTYLERYDDLRSSPHRTPNLALRMPATEPKYESKPAWWIAKQIGEKMGLSTYFAYDDYSEVLDWQLKELGSSLEELKETGIKFFDAPGALYSDPGQPISFKTASGKIELYSTLMENAGLDPMPVYTAHPEPPDGFYRLIYGRAPMHTFSRTANNQNLIDLMPENNLWINPRVAKLEGLKNGQEIYLENQDGVVSEFPIKVRVTERIRWDSVYMVHGFGHNRKEMSRAYGRGVSSTQLITNVMVDPAMGGTGMRGNFVKFHTQQPEKEA